MQANLAANRVGAMPVLYRLARPERRGARRATPALLAAGAVLLVAALGAAALGRRARRG